MKSRKTIFILMLLFTTLVAGWIVPALVKKATDDSRSYPLMYYSSRLKELCIIDFREMKDSFADVKGQIYPRTQYDSLLPLLNARQLMLDGKMPDSIEGHAVDMKTLRMKQVAYRYRPVDRKMPQPLMGVLFEAMPKRGNLTLPGDYFLLDKDMTFIDAESNRVNEEKSGRFTREMEKKGFAFPARACWGNPSVRKPYEEGYFCLDADGKLFHVKMVNGRPFVKDTHAGDSLGIKWFAMNEVSDKRFYGFVYGNQGEAGILEEADGGYRFRRMDIRPFNLDEDQLMILGNALYWTVSVQNEQGMDSYGLDMETLSCLSSYHTDRKRVLWDDVSEWMFPCYLSFDDANDAYIGFYWHAGAWKAFALNTVLALLVGLFAWRRARQGSRWLRAAYVLLCGIPGLVALWVLPGCEQ